MLRKWAWLWEMDLHAYMGFQSVDCEEVIPKWLFVHVGSQFNFFYCPISCLHLCLPNFKLSSQFSINDIFILATFAHLSSLSFHDCKRENFSFRSHILITIWTVMIFLINVLTALTFVYHCVAGRIFELYSLVILILIVGLSFIEFAIH